MRYFLAIPVPEEVKLELHKLRQEFLDYKGVKFVNPENTHLTLFFLGEIKNIKEIIDAMHNVRFKHFKLKTADMCFFPNTKKINVLCLKIEETEELRNLYNNLNIVFNEPREYKPHITFARVKFLEKDKKEEFLKKLSNLQFKSLSFEVKQFKLYSSELTPLGPIHRVAEYFTCD